MFNRLVAMMVEPSDEMPLREDESLYKEIAKHYFTYERTKSVKIVFNGVVLYSSERDTGKDDIYITLDEIESAKKLVFIGSTIIMGVVCYSALLSILKVLLE